MSMLKKIIAITLMIVFSKDAFAVLGKRLGKIPSAAGEELKDSSLSTIYVHNDSSNVLTVWQEKDDESYQHICSLGWGKSKALDYLIGTKIALKVSSTIRFFIEAEDIVAGCTLRLYEWGSFFSNYRIYRNDELLEKYNCCVGLSGCVVQ